MVAGAVIVCYSRRWQGSARDTRDGRVAWGVLFSGATRSLQLSKSVSAENALDVSSAETARPLPDRMLPRANPAVIYRSLPDGAVLFSTVDEVYFGLNPVAARVWELLPPATSSLDELCATLGREYPEVAADELREDVRTLLDELEQLGLLTGTTGEDRHVAQTSAADR
jgi:hypothetical protein